MSKIINNGHALFRINFQTFTLAAFLLSVCVSPLDSPVTFFLHPAATVLSRSFVFFVLFRRVFFFFLLPRLCKVFYTFLLPRRPSLFLSLFFLCRFPSFNALSSRYWNLCIVGGNRRKYFNKLVAVVTNISIFFHFLSVAAFDGVLFLHFACCRKMKAAKERLFLFFKAILRLIFLIYPSFPLCVWFRFSCLVFLSIFHPRVDMLFSSFIDQTILVLSSNIERTFGSKLLFFEFWALTN